MTSEVAVMNSQAIALAADSAVTFAGGTQQKTFTSASKIFTLSKFQPVGVMIYGNANFMGIPWETIIKTYRGRLGPDTFKTLGGYAGDFLAFLRTSDLLFSDSDTEQAEYLSRSIFWCFRRIKERIDERIRLELYQNGEFEEPVLQTITEQVIQGESDEWNEAEAAPMAPTSFTDEFNKMFAELNSQAQSAIFEGLPLTEKASTQLLAISLNLLMKFPARIYNPESTGVVIAGFGTDDVFPVLESYTVEGRIGSYLKHKKNEEQCEKIGVSTSARVIPFAQREMVDTFMAGIDPDYELLIRRFCEELESSFQEDSPGQVLDMIYEPDEYYDDPVGYEDIELHLEAVWPDVAQALNQFVRSKVDSFMQSLSEHKNERHFSPILSVVQGLPKDELAAMAESLINLTSFKRKVSMQAETVGGPIDVAVISRGDGFIWINRKYYFEGEMNPHFFANYYN